ncbi:type II toxin-antitoxin system PemK/MazF family toxin [Rhodococcus opacus]|uniref:type II toxin-antitoxin system PemK/MazF family toxin n=1 Tax=Rhodococcus opacus TaxID=37919 RepID=UPI0024BA05C2|nr:type II toxin-antitoxin system PemK/MazF family toxin [Rhodococcus opacus]MDJ0413814.1 type II toxin-antitoxin system PemK/MazF family toxin [Rhodococcus opacus]
MINFDADPPRRGEVYWADLTPARGSEQDGHRPVLVVSLDSFNRQMRTVVTAAMTSQVKPSVREGRSPVAVFIPKGPQGMEKDGAVLCFQITTLARERLEDYICQLTPEQMRDVDRAMAASFGLAEWTGRAL